MKKATLVVSKDFINNKIFDATDSKLNRDNCLAPFIDLRKSLLAKGIELNTQDITNIYDAEFVIYNDMPKILPAKKDISKSYLLIMESPIIVKSSWIKSKHEFFAKIFTWKDSVIDNKKYFKINYTHSFPNEFNWPTSKRQKLCTLISAHKLSNLKNELYSERIKAIRWFEANHPEDFDLYGVGWDKPAFHGLFKAIKKIPFYEKMIPFKKFTSYKGPVNSKYETFINYDFAVCYENIKDEDGYITEKIFDCFFAGTIPIYWGASNISEHIPEDCYIDYRKYGSIEGIFTYISKLSFEEKNDYRVRINNFLISSLSDKFKTEYFVDQIVQNVYQRVTR